MIRLRVSGIGGPAQQRRFDQDEVIIGRSSRAHLLLSDPALSREHARLVRREGAWFVEDLGSRNGTTHNGQRVDRPRRLHPGDHLGLGSTTLTVEEVGAPAVTLAGEGQEGQPIGSRPAMR